MEPECNDEKLMNGVIESFIKRCSVLKTRRGRAGLVHNFLRGLQLMSEPSGEPRLLRGWGGTYSIGRRLFRWLFQIRIILCSYLINLRSR